MEFGRYSYHSFDCLTSEIQKRTELNIPQRERRNLPLLGCSGTTSLKRCLERLTCHQNDDTYEGLEHGRMQSLENLSEEAWRQIIQYRSLTQLPEEILVLIMKQLSPDGLWTIRQTSSVFFRIFQSEEDFHPFHRDPALTERHVRFSLDSLTADQKQIVKTYLRPEPKPGVDKAPVTQDAHRCASCAEVHQRGEHDPRLINLRRLYFCDACEENHAGIFFPAESLRNYLNRTGDRLVCVGRLGQCTVCSHNSHPPVTWHTVEQVMSHATSTLRKSSTYCQEADHAVTYLKKTEPKMKEVVCAFPRLRVEEHLGHAELRFGWDLPLFDMDAKNPPPLPDIRQFATELIRKGALGGLKCCQHVVDGGQLQNFTSSICRCFAKPGNTKSPSDGDCCMAGQTDTGQGQRVLECEECGGEYAWQLVSGRLLLSYRYCWEVIRPVSPGWLGILDNVPGLVYSEENKHLLWCDEPACSTGHKQRWMELVKEETWLQKYRFGNFDKLEKDSEIMLHKSTASNRPKSGYRMPLIFADPRCWFRNDIPEELLRQIRAARKQAVASRSMTLPFRNGST